MIGIKRDITDKILSYINNDLILLLVGSRQTGKTFILRQIEEYLKNNNLPNFYINLEDPTYLELLNQHPKNIFKIFTIDTSKQTFIIIDEIQYLNNPTNFLKLLYDEYKDQIKLIVSGSSAFYIDDKFKDSLAGRKKIFEVRTLSFPEFLRFKNKEVLTSDTSINGLKEKELLYEEYMIWGGYPRVVLSPKEEKANLLQELAYSYIKKDIFESKIKRDESVYKLLKILASQIGGLVNTNELSKTLNISKTAVNNYLYVMQKSFHLALIRPFYQNTRKELIKMPKIYFYDLGMRNFFYGDFSPPTTRQDLGLLLENAVFRQLLDRYNDLEKIKFWRTIQKNEVDFIIDQKLAFEVKVTASKFNPAKYQQFRQLYPNIELKLVSYKKDTLNCLLPFEI